MRAAGLAESLLAREGTDATFHIGRSRAAQVHARGKALVILLVIIERARAGAGGWTNRTARSAYRERERDREKATVDDEWGHITQIPHYL